MMVFKIALPAARLKHLFIISVFDPQLSQSPFSSSSLSPGYCGRLIVGIPQKPDFK